MQYETDKSYKENAYRKTVDGPQRAELVKLRKSILDLQNEKDRSMDEFARMYEAYSDGKITREEFKKFSENHRVDFFALMESEDKLIEEMKVMDQRNDTLETWIKQFRKYKKNPDITRELIDVMVSEILIRSKLDFTVEYNFKEI